MRLSRDIADVSGRPWDAPRAPGCRLILPALSPAAREREIGEESAGSDSPEPLPAAAGLTLMKPMSLAYWRKHCRHMFSPYLRMRPWRLEHTRLRGEQREAREGGEWRRGGRGGM